MTALKTAKCVRCGGIIFRLNGKSARFCHDICLECRGFERDQNAADAAARTLTEEPKHDE